MKLNPDCVRDILLSIEELTGIGKVIVFSTAKNLNLDQYSDEEIAYHIQQCEYSSLIIVSSRFINGGCIIRDLTPSGHEFLANIRSNNNWNKTKEISKKVGSTSLNVMSQIAANVISELLKKSF
ncbi:MAG: DUF2513 domain-containing protein [Bacilli bacterium]